MEFPTQHEDLRKAWLHLRDTGQSEHADVVWYFAQMFKENYEQMKRFQHLADNLQRQNNQDTYEAVRRKAIRNCGGSRKAANE